MLILSTLSLTVNNSQWLLLMRDVGGWLDRDLLTLTRAWEAGAAAGGSSPTSRMRSRRAQRGDDCW